MKPFGLTFDLQVVRPTAAEDAIWEAVSQAIARGMTASEFRSECADAWASELRELAKGDDEVLRR